MWHGPLLANTVSVTDKWSPFVTYHLFFHKGENTMNSLKLLVSAGLVAVTAMSLTACTDSEIAFGAGVIVGVIIDDEPHHHHRPHPPRYRRGRRYAEVNLSALSPAQRVAVKYNLSQGQADLLTSELIKVQSGDLSGLRTLGFDAQDLVQMTQGQNPSASTLQKLSSALGLELVQAHDLIQNIKLDVAKAQERML
jgi:hypothetical protein